MTRSSTDACVPARPSASWPKGHSIFEELLRRKSFRRKEISPAGFEPAAFGSGGRRQNRGTPQTGKELGRGDLVEVLPVVLQQKIAKSSGHISRLVGWSACDLC